MTKRFFHSHPIFLIIFAIIGGLWLTTAKPIFAQQADGLNVTLSPSLMELTGNPGDIVQQKFRIRNNNSTPVDLTVKIGKLEPHTENGQVVPIEPVAGDTSTSWLHFDTPTFTAPVKEWKDVAFQITIPKDAAFGYAFAVQISQSPNPTPTNTVAAKLIGQLVLPVLLNVKSTGSKAELKFDSFKTASYINEYLPTTFQVKLSNVGNVYVKPQGNIFLRSSTGNDVATLDINPKTGAILPTGTRTFAVDWSDGFLVREPIMQDGNPVADSHGIPKTQLKINWNKLTAFRFGKYTATALVVYDNGERDISMEASTSFWVIPYKIIGGTILGILIIFFGLRFLIGWYIAKEVKKHTPPVTPTAPLTNEPPKPNSP